MGPHLHDQHIYVIKSYYLGGLWLLPNSNVISLRLTISSMVSVNLFLCMVSKFFEYLVWMAY